jgi:hypothetical protein
LRRHGFQHGKPPRHPTNVQLWRSADQYLADSTSLPDEGVTFLAVEARKETAAIRDNIYLYAAIGTLEELGKILVNSEPYESYMKTLNVISPYLETVS